MNTKKGYVLMIALMLVAGTALWATLAWAAPGNAPLAPGGSPTVVAYQGEVRVSSIPYTGAGYFKFAIVNATGSTTYWSNDGTSTAGGEPTAAVSLTVGEGLFGLLLGDTTLGGMTQVLTADIFSDPDCYLRVWFSSDGSTFSQLAPDTRIASVPYALQAQEAADADTVDGFEGAVLEESAEIDADIAAHAATADAHHARYTDTEAWAATLANDGAGSTLDADTVDGLHASELGTHYQNVVVVAKSGGDYASVQAAIDSITDAGADNPYLVWVAPGVYNETVTMKPYVHLQGAGQEVTIITSTASDSNSPPTQATLVLTRDVSLRDLTVGNEGSGTYNVALLATDGTTRTLAVDVTARALGSGAENYGVYLTGSGTDVTLQQVTALAKDGTALNIGLFNNAAVMLRGGSFTGRGGAYARGINNAGTLDAESIIALGENGSGENHGLYNLLFAEAMLRGSSFTARGGDDAWGIYNGISATLEAEGVTALGEGSAHSYGLDNGGAATLRGGSFTGRAGTYAYGIANSDSGTTLEAENVTALGENGASYNYGLRNISGATATLHGGSFTGSGGTYAYGINNYYTDAMLTAESVIALGENGSHTNYGLYNALDAVAMLRGGSLTGRGGTYAYAVYNGNSAMLEAENVTTLAENGSSHNYGLYNVSSAEAILRGGSFTGRGGGTARGIYNYNDNATLEAENITALGENSNNNCGFYNSNSAVATLRGGSFTGRGGQYAQGIYNDGSGTTLKAESVTALAEDGSLGNYGLYNAFSAAASATQSVLEGATNSVYRSSGAVTVSNSRLVSSAVFGTVTCVAVSRNTTFNANGCP